MQIHIDTQSVDVSPGMTVLAAAEKIGVHIPTLCYDTSNVIGQDTERGCAPSTSCLVCLVKVDGRMAPACATMVTDGMVVESETETVRQLRRDAIELLLSDHRGDCHAPCQFACPAKMDIPKMLRYIQQRQWGAAIATVKERIALPTVLGRVCPAPCEKVCRRNSQANQGVKTSSDSPTDTPYGAVAICQLKRFVADTDLGEMTPWVPVQQPETGKTVVIFGAGASGLSAAFYLSAAGHDVVLYEKEPLSGGRMRLYPEDVLPANVLDTEIGHLLSLPITLATGEMVEVSDEESLNHWLNSFDAVVLATGVGTDKMATAAGLKTLNQGVVVQGDTFETSRSGVFAIGTAVRPKAMLARSIADGYDAAQSIDHYLRTGTAAAQPPLFSVRIRKLLPEELVELIPNSVAAARIVPDDPGLDDYTEGRAATQAARCYHCDCAGREKCKLLRAAELYRVEKDRFPTESPPPIRIHRGHNVVYEPAKCIRCGVCIRVCRNEPIGLTFIGRGFDVQVGVPFGHSLSDALRSTAAACIQSCPTGALVGHPH